MVEEVAGVVEEEVAAVEEEEEALFISQIFIHHYFVYNFKMKS